MDEKVCPNVWHVLYIHAHTYLSMLGKQPQTMSKYVIQMYVFSTVLEANKNK